MKNVSLILNGVLLVAVIVLYVLFFSSGKKPVQSGRSAADTSMAALAQGGIVYVNVDSVIAHYDMFTDLQADFEEKLKTSEAQLATQEKNLRKEAEDFQYKVERGLVTRAEAEQLQQQLMGKEQNLYQLQNSLQMQLAEENQVAQRKVLNSIMEYLKKLEETEGTTYQYVLGTTSFGGNILYAEDENNITKAVVAGLNAEYAKDKEE